MNLDQNIIQHWANLCEDIQNESTRMTTFPLYYKGKVIPQPADRIAGLIAIVIQAIIQKSAEKNDGKIGKESKLNKLNRIQYSIMNFQKALKENENERREFEEYLTNMYLSYVPDGMNRTSADKLKRFTAGFYTKTVLKNYFDVRIEEYI